MYPFNLLDNNEFLGILNHYIYLMLRPNFAWKLFPRGATGR